MRLALRVLVQPNLRLQLTGRPPRLQWGAAIRAGGPQLKRYSLAGGKAFMSDHGLQSYGEIVAHYFAEKRPKHDNELRWFRIQPKVHDAVRLAGLASGPHGKRFRHQYRIPQRALQRASRALLRNLRRLGRCKSFDALLQQIDATISPIPRVGPLMVYDTALRIGARLGLSPERVYLHAGTRHGAAVLGFGRHRGSVSPAELAPPLNALTAEQAEDVLCIYAADLARLVRPPSNLRLQLSGRRPTLE